MPYCPECLTEYVKGVTRCRDCGTPLRPGSPAAAAVSEREMEMSPDVKLVKIRTLSGPNALLAGLVRNLLRTQGIPCILPGEDSAAMFPGLEIPLLVREQDEVAATELLKSYLDSPGPKAVE